MNRLTDYFASGMLLFLLMSCSDEGMYVHPTGANRPQITDHADARKLAQETLTLSAEDAKNVALQFVGSSNLLTRSLGGKYVKEVLPLTDSIHRALLYVTNFSDDAGFVIVSATKEFYPILAYSDEGSFSMDPNSMATLWIKAMGKEIVYRMDDAVTTRNSQWSAYERMANSAATRAIPSYQNVYWWRAELIHDILYTDLYPPRYDYNGEYGELTGEGFYTMAEVRNMFHMDMGALDNLEARLNGMGYASDAAIFHVKHFSDSYARGPLLSTYWKQGEPYNAYCPNNYPPGCVPVALGQIINYHRWPSGYAAWNSMDIPPYDAEARLLKKIGDDVGGMVYRDNGSYPRFWDPLDLSDLSHAKKFFREHQYTVAKQAVGGNIHKVAGSILSMNPVYMEGTQELFSFLGIRIPSLNGAHAWVCDGYTFHGICDLLVDVYYPDVHNPGNNVPLDANPYKRDWYPPELSEGYSWQYFHMNWGWGYHELYQNLNLDLDGLKRKDNGWFLNADISQLNGVDFTVFYRFVTATPNR